MSSGRRQVAKPAGQGELARPARPAVCRTALGGKGTWEGEGRKGKGRKRGSGGGEEGGGACAADSSAAAAAAPDFLPQPPRSSPLFFFPSRFASVVNTTRRMLRFNPIPTASEATKTSTPDLPGSLKARACERRVSGGSAP